MIVCYRVKGDKIYMKEYKGVIPPCGIYCGECPKFLRGINPCEGAEDHCKDRKCKGIFVCCREKKATIIALSAGFFPVAGLKSFQKNGLNWDRI